MKKSSITLWLVTIFAAVALVLAIAKASGVATSIPEVIEEHIRVSEELRRREREAWAEDVLGAKDTRR